MSSAGLGTSLRLVIVYVTLLYFRTSDYLSSLFWWWITRVQKPSQIMRVRLKLRLIYHWIQYDTRQARHQWGNTLGTLGRVTTNPHDTDISSCCSMMRLSNSLCKAKSNINLDNIFNNNHFRAMEIAQRHNNWEVFILKEKEGIFGKNCGNMHSFLLGAMFMPPSAPAGWWNLYFYQVALAVDTGRFASWVGRLNLGPETKTHGFVI